jgi:hypothetical protein
MLGIGIPYLVCLLHVELSHVAGLLGTSVDGTCATNSSQSSGLPFLPFCCASRVNIVDVWVQDPLMAKKLKCLLHHVRSRT